MVWPASQLKATDMGGISSYMHVRSWRVLDSHRTFTPAKGECWSGGPRASPEQSKRTWLPLAR